MPICGLRTANVIKAIIVPKSGQQYDVLQKYLEEKLLCKVCLSLTEKANLIE